MDLPHDWVITLPFKNDPALSSKGFYPIGRSYPENSVGWYRRVFDVPTEDKEKRLSIEFDGVYREALVVFNGYYIGRHLAFITAEVQDADGRALPITDNEVTFTATGTGRIIGTGNGDPGSSS